VNNKTTLPYAWASRIFERLTAIYGREFSGKYESGQFIDTAAGKLDSGIAGALQVWREELGGFHDKPECIAYGLEHLPSKAPNMIEFRDLCRQAPRKELPQITRQFTEEEMAANRKKVAGITAQLGRMVMPAGNEETRLHPHWVKLATGDNIQQKKFEDWPRCTQLAIIKAYKTAGVKLSDAIVEYAKKSGMEKYLPTAQQGE